MSLALEPWTEGSLELLRRCNTPAMTEHLGRGPAAVDRAGC